MELLHGDCIEVMAGLPAASVGAVVTDPPYGLGFMGREWDTFDAGAVALRAARKARKGTAIPAGSGELNAAGYVEYDYSRRGLHGFQSWCERWGREALRVLKPGGYLVSFGSPRTYHRLASGLEDAGFVVKDSLMWLYGSGFPKSLNLGDGVGTALKPAHEPIVLAQKPLQGTYAANVARWGVGGLAIDGCRIPATDNTTKIRTAGDRSREQYRTGTSIGGPIPTDLGRWPTNLLLTRSGLPVARLSAIIPREIERLIRGYFDGYTRVLELRDRVRGTAGLGQIWSPQVLQPEMQRGVPEDAQGRGEPAPGQAQYARGASGDESGGATAGTPAVATERATPGMAWRDVHVARLSLSDDRDAECAGSGTRPADDDLSLHPGTPDRDGAHAGAAPAALRVGASHQWGEGGQSPRESGIAGGVGTLSAASRNGSGVRTAATAEPPLDVLVADLPQSWWEYFDLTGEDLGCCNGVCAPGCPVAALDAQSGERTSNSGKPFNRADVGYHGGCDPVVAPGYYGDSGGASRFYPTFRFEADDFAPFLYVAKAARSEREKGLRALAKATPGERTGRAEGSAGLDSPRAGAGRTNAGANVHPTVKPVQLMRWLVRLVTPPGETVLDPFLGSGTTGVAATMEGRDFIGIEREAQYLEIARHRLIAAQPGLPLGAA